MVNSLYDTLFAVFALQRFFATPNNDKKLIISYNLVFNIFYFIGN